VQYTNPGTIFEQGLYRRRLAELCMFLGLPWQFALTAVLKRVIGIIVDRTDPFFIIEMAEVSAQAKRDAEMISEPEPAPPPPKPPEPVKPPPEAPPEAPNVDPARAPKPMEDSKTFNGLSKKESGQETVAVGGTLAGLAVFLPYIDAVTAYLSKYPATVIFSALGVVGVLTAGVGAWRWYAGKMIAFEGRQEAVQAKV
jgi:hypothetical protein